MKSPQVESDNRAAEWLDTVRRQVETLRFGVVQVVVHDSRVVQIEKTERIRLERSEAR